MNTHKEEKAKVTIVNNKTGEKRQVEAGPGELISYSANEQVLLSEPTPPSQIEEEPRLNEPGKIIPYKTFRGKRYVDLDWLLKELEAINKLTKE